METILWVAGALVAFVVYFNLGWLLNWAFNFPEKTGWFKWFFDGPPIAQERTTTSKEAPEWLCVSLWPLMLVTALVLWTFQIIVWFCKAAFGGIAKRIVHYRE